jgi:hypothetical protein
MQYIALIGDIVNSKGQARRGDLQRMLADVLKENSERKPKLASPYTITLGDEFQAVYKSADNLFLDIFSILAKIAPTEARFGIGVGELTTAINPKQALGMDGPAFHRARDSITILKKSGYLIRVQGNPPPQEEKEVYDHWKLLNNLLNFVSHKVGAWEQNRLRILVGLLKGQSVAELERELGVSNVAVYKNINAGPLDELLGLCHEITNLLNRELKSR